jgi:ribosomal-protein-alanine N-acetyltransferase
MSGRSPLRASSISLRYLIRRDLTEVLQIEKASYAPTYWGEEDFLHCLRQRNCIATVAEHNDHIVGYTLYLQQKTHLHLLNIAVHPLYRRVGVGTRLVTQLKDKLSPYGRFAVLAEVHEANLRAQLFFKSQGFKAVTTIRSFYEDTGGDAFLMEYRCPDPRPDIAAGGYLPVNRLSPYVESE